jgi:hypothetical protein
MRAQALLLLLCAARAHALATLTRRRCLAGATASLAGATAILAPAAPAVAGYSSETVAKAKEAWAVADPSRAQDWVPLIVAGDGALGELLDNWPAITAKNDGDAVRRYLGTVGITSPLFKIRPALAAIIKARDLPDAFDVVAFAEVSEEFLSDLQAAEGAAYGANFADFSTSVGKGGLSPAATQLAKCREDVRRLKKRSGEMVALLGPLRK